MLRFLKSFFGKYNAPEPQVPYKVEAPVDVAPAVVSAPEPARCGCGRSASGFCVGLHKLTAEEWAAHPENKAKPAARKPAARKPAAKKEAAPKKPAAMKAAPKPRAKKPAK